MRHKSKQIVAALGITLVLALAGCSTSAATASGHTKSSTKATSNADKCAKYYEIKASKACESGDLREADRLESDYENGRGEYKPPKPAKNEVGSTLSNGGATITVTSAGDAPGIQWNDTYYTQGSGLDTYITKAPAPGNKYFVISATVTNTGTQSMDLTCSLPVVFKVLSAKQQSFDPIDDLYNVQGNPECNNFMQPESSEPMTWVFETPSDAHIIGAYFYESLSNQANAAIFTFDTNYDIGVTS